MTDSGGWYPDPAGRYASRWRDTDWTKHVSDGANVFIDTVAWNEPAPDEAVFCRVCDQKNLTVSACRRCGVDLGRHGVFGPRHRIPAPLEEVVRTRREAMRTAAKTFRRAMSQAQTAEAACALDEVAESGASLLRLMALPSTGGGPSPQAIVASGRKTKLRGEDLVAGAHGTAVMAGHRRASAAGTPLQQMEEAVLVARVGAIELIGATPLDELATADLLRRFADLYLPDGWTDPAPDELESAIAARLSAVEGQLPELNRMLVDYAEAFRWAHIGRYLELLAHPAGAPGSHGDEAPFLEPTLMSPVEAASLLEISVDASPKELKSAYRREAVKYHPDRLNGVPVAIVELSEAKMRLINEAYGVLRNTVRQEV